ncbi:UNVERIFIED_ORG: carbon-monoxide dehydrogenase medium subunit [Gordonia westfalica J30]
MKPSSFGYHRAGSVSTACRLLAELGEDAKILAGGQSLVAMMAFRLARPSDLLDIGGVDELDYLDVGPAELRIGALTTHHRVEKAQEVLTDNGFGVIAGTMPYIGHLPIRTRGTVGGSLAHADATAEWCLLAELLDAQIVVTSVRGERVIDAHEFFFGFFATALDEDELITELRFPRPAPNAAVAEFANRHGDFAVVAAGVDLDVDPAAGIRAGRVAMAGTQPVPVTIAAAGEVLADCGELTPHLVDACVEAAVAELDLTDQADPEYVRGVARTQVRSALWSAAPEEVRSR